MVPNCTGLHENSYISQVLAKLLHDWCILKELKTNEAITDNYRLWLPCSPARIEKLAKNEAVVSGLGLPVLSLWSKFL